MRFKKQIKLYKNIDTDWISTEQIIVCGNGVFKKIKINSITYVYKKTSFEKLNLDSEKLIYDNFSEKEIFLQEKPYLIKKIPIKLIEAILEFYIKYAQKNLEVKLNIWHDKESGDFFIDCPFQRITSVAVTEIAVDHPDIEWNEELQKIYPEKYEMFSKVRNRVIEKIFETHSHHSTTR